MHTLLTEPVAPRYIHINPATNKVHLLVPVAGGQEISTDNTCKANAALKEFFDGHALRELYAYKEALIIDLLVLGANAPERPFKKERLEQIEIYIEAIAAMQFSYAQPVNALFNKESNLHSIQLRPTEQDPQSTVVKPVFTVQRGNDGYGQPLSPLYNAMMSEFRILDINALGPKDKLKNRVLSLLPPPESYKTREELYKDIQQVLNAQSFEILGINVDFTRRADGQPATQKDIDKIIFLEDATQEEYVDTLLSACISWDSLANQPFYSSSEQNNKGTQAEHYSILTQFFLANINVYCKSKGISEVNFGVVLDNSRELSEEFVSKVSKTLAEGNDVGKALCDFCNANAEHFKLRRLLDEKDLNSVQHKFTRAYQTVTATKDNPHMDDFLILDLDTADKAPLFVTHQGSICVNFAELVDPFAVADKAAYFATVRKDFETHPVEIDHKNNFIFSESEIDLNVLITQLTYAQIEKLPTQFKELCYASPNFKLPQFLHHVARGENDEAQLLLKHSPNAQNLLLSSASFTDYSGRSFNCSAFEYAYWAGDAAMCTMLLNNMNEDTKGALVERIKELNKNGLVFKQDNQEQRSTHFDFNTLRNAINLYLSNQAVSFGAMRDGARNSKGAGWLDIGMAQRDVPAYMAQTYCMTGKSTSRNATYFNRFTQSEESWYPLTPGVGLGFTVSIIGTQLGARGSNQPVMQAEPNWIDLNNDLKMIHYLDQEASACRNSILGLVYEAPTQDAGMQFDADEIHSSSGFELDDEQSESEPGFSA